MNNIKIPRFLKDDSLIYFLLITLLTSILIVEGMYYYAAISGAVSLIISAMTFRKQLHREKELKKYIIEYTNNIEDISVNSFYNSPMPVSIIDAQGKVFWYNTKFRELIGESFENIESITEFYPDFPLKSLDKNNGGTISNIDIAQHAKSFNILYNVLEEKKFGDGKSYLMYWVDNTLYSNIKVKRRTSDSNAYPN